MSKARGLIQSSSPSPYGFTAPLSGTQNEHHHLRHHHPTPLSPIMTPAGQERFPVTSSGISTSTSTSTPTSASDAASPALPGPEPAYEQAKRAFLFQREGMPYGTTRYSAVFSENHASFGPAILDEAGEIGARVPHSGSNPPHLGLDDSNARRELAINTMMEFPTLRTCESLMQNVPEMYDVWQSPVMIRQCLNQVWTEYGACLGTNRSRESVSVMVDDILETGKRPLSNPDPRGTDGTSWHNWFGGPRLRWEMIGILFTWAGMIFRHKQECDRIFELPEQQGRNRKTAAENMRVCANSCLRLCDDFVEINDIIIVLMKNCAKLRSNIISDESDHLRMDFGTTGAAFITAGLHRLPVSPILTPLSQYRCIISSSFFHLDKCESLFNGRPPILDKRFCYIPLPLDLSEEDVYNGDERFQAAVKRLDANGWNTDNQIYATTWLRAVSLLSPIREEILGLSLTASLKYTKAQVDALVTQLEQIVGTYPPHIRYHTIEHPDHSQSRKRAPHEIYLITRIQLDILQCAFLLQRLLVSRGYCNGQKLFNIAYDMIHVVLSLWSDSEHLRDFNFAFDWIILSYGIPCAGILCLELLRASNLAPPMAPTETMPSPTPVQLSRSEVVQTLTMFIAFLNWIRPTDNNVQLCGKFKKVVKRIIDTAIDAPRPTPPPPVHAGGQPRQSSREPPVPGHLPNVEAGDDHHQFHPPPLQGSDALAGTELVVDDPFDPALMALDDLDWLNTVDWTQGDWLELSQQDLPCPTTPSNSELTPSPRSGVWEMSCPDLIPDQKEDTYSVPTVQYNYERGVRCGDLTVVSGS
ncbi:hypothetical protein LZ554_001670 [Drepanopeziza brunnea f. sp. 'monogermtubi']|nr:hypothetical protein LZ554_001670 [Drepanopeziza brunnea f. sp. 'monogermtubi']